MKYAVLVWALACLAIIADSGCAQSRAEFLLLPGSSDKVLLCADEAAYCADGHLYALKRFNTYYFQQIPPGKYRHTCDFVAHDNCGSELYELWFDAQCGSAESYYEGDR